MERYTLYKILKTVTGVYQSFFYFKVVWVKDKKNTCNLISKTCFLSFIKGYQSKRVIS